MAITAFMESTTSSEALRSMASSSGRFLARSRSSTNSAFFTSLSGSALRSDAAASAGRNAISTPIRFALTPDLRTYSVAFCMASTEPAELVLPSGVQNGFTSFWWLSSRWPKKAAFSGAPLG